MKNRVQNKAQKQWLSAKTDICPSTKMVIYFKKLLSSLEKLKHFSMLSEMLHVILNSENDKVNKHLPASLVQPAFLGFRHLQWHTQE